MQSFFTISGSIRRIESHGDCSLIMSVTDTGGGPVNLIIDSSTYVVDMEMCIRDRHRALNGDLIVAQGYAV